MIIYSALSARNKSYVTYGTPILASVHLTSINHHWEAAIIAGLSDRIHPRQTRSNSGSRRLSLRDFLGPADGLHKSVSSTGQNVLVVVLSSHPPSSSSRSLWDNYDNSRVSERLSHLRELDYCTASNICHRLAKAIVLIVILQTINRSQSV